MEDHGSANQALKSEFGFQNPWSLFRDPYVMMYEIVQEYNWVDVHPLQHHVGANHPHRVATLCSKFPLAKAAKHWKNLQRQPLVGGWTNPFEKYGSKWVHLPQFFGVKIKKNWVATTQDHVSTRGPSLEPHAPHAPETRSRDFLNCQGTERPKVRAASRDRWKV